VAANEINDKKKRIIEGAEYGEFMSTERRARRAERAPFPVRCRWS
jgi:hypothetical protein